MKSRRIYLILGILFVVLVAGCTIYSRTVYQYSLPRVELGVSRNGTFSYAREEKTTVDVGNAAPEGYAYGVTVTMPLETLNTKNFYMYEGDKVEVEFPSMSRSRLEGTVTSIHYEEEAVIMQVGFNTERELAQGDDAVVSINKETAPMACIVPSTALQEDIDGKSYVFLVKEEDGPWGEDYVLKKEYVDVWASTATEVSFEKLENFTLPVVINSDQLLSEGMKVRFYP
jgi:hypothetical protein